MSEQFWGVCVSDDETGWEIQGESVYSSHEQALHEAMMWTHETQVQHVVKPVRKKKTT